MMKMMIMIIIIVITGTISKSFRKYMNNTPEKHEVQKLQGTPALGTAHILRKVKVKVIPLQAQCGPEVG
jgi:uncharacterized protein YpmB